MTNLHIYYFLVLPHSELIGKKNYAPDYSTIYYNVDKEANK